jgi:hypothetical protein
LAIEALFAKIKADFTILKGMAAATLALSIVNLVLVIAISP